MVFGIAYNLLNNASLAEEVAQDVFLQLHRSRPGIRSGAHLVYWLRRTATHRSIDILRRKGTENEVQMEVLPEVAAEVRVSDPLLERKLRKLVASLPAKQRAVLVLRFGEDMDVGEISRTLDIPARTVWSHLQRALELLRAKAAPYVMEERK